MANPPNFNPSIPSLVGLEWLPTSRRVLQLNTPKVALVQRFRSPGVVTPLTIHQYLSAVTDQTSDLAFCTEIIDTLTPAVSTSTYRPSVDVTTIPTGLVLSTARSQAGTTASLYSTVDESTLDVSDYITRTTAGVSWAWGARTTIAAGDLAGRRIVRVRAKAVAKCTSAVGTPGSWVTAGIYDGSSFYPGSRITLVPGKRATLSYSWDINPTTGLPWLPSEVELFRNSGGSRAIYFVHTPRGASTAAIYQAWLEVDTVVENRKGYNYSTGLAQGWNALALSSASALASNTFYYLVSWCPRPTAALNVTIPILADTATSTATSAGTTTAREHRQVYDMQTRNGSGVLGGSSSSIATVEIAPFLLQTTGSQIGISSVSAPYVALRGIAVNSDGPTGFGTEITTSASQSYAYATFVAGWESATRPTGPLTVTFVQGAGTGAGTVRATGTLKAEKGDTAALRRYLVKFASPYSAGGATQFSLRFTSTAAPGKGWAIVRYDQGTNALTSTSAAQVESVGLGGQSDSYFSTLTRDTRYDLACNIVSTANPPTGFVAVTQEAT